jgi:hypothetical protein
MRAKRTPTKRTKKTPKTVPKSRTAATPTPAPPLIWARESIKVTDDMIEGLTRLASTPGISENARKRLGRELKLWKSLRAGLPK